MKKRTSTKRKPVRKLTAAEERQQVTQMMRKAGLYAFSDRLAALKKSHGVDPKRVEKILVSPYGPLGAQRELEKVRLRLTHYRAILDTLDIELDTRHYREVAVRITQLEQDEARLQQTVQMIVPPAAPATAVDGAARRGAILGQGSGGDPG